MKVLTLDIWDTVLRRECAPDETKLAVARFLLTYFRELINIEFYSDIFSIQQIRQKCEWNLAQASKEAGKDDEYQIQEVLEATLDEIIKGQLEISTKKNLIEKLVEIELQQEIQLTRLDHNIVEEIKKYKSDRIYLLSDFYYPSNLMTKILSRYESQLPLDGIFISCDSGYNKKSGRLFSYIESQLHITPSEHFHLGDNKKADVEIPKKMGINSIQYLPEQEQKQRELKELHYKQRLEGNLEGYLEKVKKYLPGQGNLIGEKYSLIFFDFVYEILEKAIQRKAKKIYYFTREGEFFKKIHEEIIKTDLFSEFVPRAEILEVSRMATFAPSVYNANLEEWMRLWIQYHDQSFSTFFTSLDINIEPYMSFLEKYEIQSQEIIHKIYEDERVKSLLNDKNFKEKISEELQKKRELIKKYFEEKGIFKGKENLFIVDIGWRGSIQDNIAILFPEKQIYGYYLGLFEPFYPPVSNTEKEAFLSNQNAEEYLWCLSYVDPIEMLCNSNSGSTMGYRIESNKVKAIKQKVKEEDNVYFKFTKNFQQEILSTIKIWCNFAKCYSMMAIELKPYALECLKNLVTDPDPSLIDMYFQLKHNENFGRGLLESKEQTLSLIKIFKAYYSKKARETLFRLIEQCHWPQALLKKYHLPWLNEYNQKLKQNFVEYISPFSLKDSAIVDISKYQEESREIKFYIEEFECKEQYLDIKGWALIPGINSKSCKIFFSFFNSERTYYFTVKTILRKDVTNHFSDGTNYHYSGFLVHILMSKLLSGKYQGQILIIEEEKRMSKINIQKNIQI